MKSSVIVVCRSLLRNLTCSGIVRVVGFIFLLAFAGAAQELPEAPHKVVDKTFLAIHGANLAAVLYDGEMSRNLHHSGNCMERNSFYRTPTGDFKAGKFYAANLAQVGVWVAFDYLLRKKRPENKWVKVIGLFGPAWDTSDHIRGGNGWWGCR